MALPKQLPIQNYCTRECPELKVRDIIQALEGQQMHASPRRRPWSRTERNYLKYLDSGFRRNDGLYAQDLCSEFLTQDTRSALLNHSVPHATSIIHRPPPKTATAHIINRGFRLDAIQYHFCPVIRNLNLDATVLHSCMVVHGC